METENPEENSFDEKIRIAVKDFEKRHGKIALGYAIDIVNPPSDEPGEEYHGIQGLRRNQNETIEEFIDYLFGAMVELEEKFDAEDGMLLFITEEGKTLRYDIDKDESE